MDVPLVAIFRPHERILRIYLNNRSYFHSCISASVGRRLIALERTNNRLPKITLPDRQKKKREDGIKARLTLLRSNELMLRRGKPSRRGAVSVHSRDDAFQQPYVACRTPITTREVCKRTTLHARYPAPLLEDSQTTLRREI